MGPRFRVAILGCFGKAEDGLALSCRDHFCRSGHFTGEQGRPISQQFLAAAQGSHVADSGNEFVLVNRLRQEIGSTRLQCLVANFHEIVGGNHDNRDVAHFR
jgi:hypothetical protein